MKGDTEHAAQHQHGVRYGGEPAAPQTVEQRLAAIEARVAKLEKGIEAPAEVHEALDVVEKHLEEAEKKS